MREFLSSLISPLPIFYLLLIAGSLFYFRKRKQIAKILVLIAGFWFLVISTRPVPYTVVNKLEGKYSVLNEVSFSGTNREVHILVLAAGHTDDESLPPNSQLSGSALGRLTEGIRLHKLIPGSKLILSGPGGKKGFTQADALFRTALIMGADSSSIFLMHNAKNTSGEAMEYKQLFGSHHQLILVTSAIHMPRAMMIFGKNGMNPVPAPTNFIIKHGSRKDPSRWMPDAGNAGIMAAAIHEYVGMFWSWIGGR